MPYDATIPQASNLVRTSAGDLAKMQENFVHLEPVATSGLHGLMSGGASVASGQVAVTQGGAASDWHYVTFQLGSLTNVSTLSPASGQVLIFSGGEYVNGFAHLSNLLDVSGTDSPSLDQVLKWNGTTWAPGTDGGGGGGASAAPSGILTVTMASAAVQTLTTATPTIITGLEQRHASGGGTGWETTTSGLVVPSGLSHLQIFVGARWEAGATGIRRLNLAFGEGGVEATPDLTRAYVSQDAAATDQTWQNFATSVFPTTGYEGKHIALRAHHTQGTDLDVEWGGDTDFYDTFLCMVGWNISGGGGGGAGNTDMVGEIHLQQAAVQSVPDNQAKVITGMEVRSRTGIFEGCALDLASGVIYLPSGADYFRVVSKVSFVADVDGYRRMILKWKEAAGDPAVTDTNFCPANGVDYEDQRSGTAAGFGSTPQVLTNLLPASGVSGTIYASGIHLACRHTAGAPLDTTPSATYLTVEAWTVSGSSGKP